VDYLKFIKGLFGWGKTGRIENEKEKKKMYLFMCENKGRK